MALAEDNPGELPVVALTPFECLQIAEGRALTHRTLHGQKVIVRLYTPEELMEANRRACEMYPGGPPRMTHMQAVSLTRPMDLG